LATPEVVVAADHNLLLGGEDWDLGTGGEAMYSSEGPVIGLKRKVVKYKEIVRKMMENERLTQDEKEFLKKEGIKAKRN